VTYVLLVIALVCVVAKVAAERQCLEASETLLLRGACMPVTFCSCLSTSYNCDCTTQLAATAATAAAAAAAADYT
jgi:hypothetical protein